MAAMTENDGLPTSARCTLAGAYAMNQRYVDPGHWRGRSRRYW